MTLASLKPGDPVALIYGEERFRDVVASVTAARVKLKTSPFQFNPKTNTVVSYSSMIVLHVFRP